MTCKHFKPLLFLMLVGSGWAAASENPGGWVGELTQQFATPPDSARMWTWWFWLGDKVDGESITADLEALKAQGMAGVTVYSLSGPGVATKGPDYMSPEWRGLFKHTLKEADRLGLGVSFMLCSGWNAGGPWIKPAQACKRHVSSELVLTGPRHFSGKLPAPPADPRFYEDVAVQAFPFTAGQPAGAVVPPCKTLDGAYGDSQATPIKDVCAAPLIPLPEAAPGAAVEPASLVDLSAKCSKDGTLEWDVPPGQWKVLRIGSTLTGAMTSWSSPTGNGLEADALDPAAMDFQFANAAAPLIEDAGPLAGKVLRSVQIDSWEINLPNWTNRFVEEFTSFIHWVDSPATLKPTADRAFCEGLNHFLDLGAVRDLAEVRINGKNLGTLWTPPWQMDITDALGPEANTLQVRITNLWPNRLLGDAALPVAKRLTSTNIPVDKTPSLLDSGLLGPVRLGWKLK